MLHTHIYMYANYESMALHYIITTYLLGKTALHFVNIEFSHHFNNILFVLNLSSNG